MNTVKLNSADVGVELKPWFDSIRSASSNMPESAAVSLTSQLLIFWLKILAPANIDIKSVPEPTSQLLISWLKLLAPANIPLKSFPALTSQLPIS